MVKYSTRDPKSLNFDDPIFSLLLSIIRETQKTYSQLVTNMTASFWADLNTCIILWLTDINLTIIWRVYSALIS